MLPSFKFRCQQKKLTSRAVLRRFVSSRVLSDLGCYCAANETASSGKRNTSRRRSNTAPSSAYVLRLLSKMFALSPWSIVCRDDIGTHSFDDDDDKTSKKILHTKATAQDNAQLTIHSEIDGWISHLLFLPISDHVAYSRVGATTLLNKSPRGFHIYLAILVPVPFEDVKCHGWYI